MDREIPVAVSTLFGAGHMSSISPPTPGHPVADDANRPDGPPPSWWPDPRVPPLLRSGEWAFQRDLPELLKKHKGKYVAYNGLRRIAIDRSERKLMDLCTKQGLIWYEYVVRLIDPAKGRHEPIWEGDDPAEENARFQEARRASLLDGTMPPLIWYGEDAYLRDLRELIKNHEGQWVVYSGDRRVGITRTDRQALELAAKEGLKDDEFLLRRIIASDLDYVPWPDYSDL
jgi:hypothetical protein